MDIAIIMAMMINRAIEEKKNRGPSDPKDGNRSKRESELVGEIVSIFDDIVEVQDEGGQIHSFRLVALDIPAEFADLKGLKTEKSEVGDRVRVNQETGRLTLIQKVVKGN